MECLVTPFSPSPPPDSSTHRFGRVKSTPVINYQLVSRFAFPRRKSAVFVRNTQATSTGAGHGVILIASNNTHRMAWDIPKPCGLCF